MDTRASDKAGPACWSHNKLYQQQNYTNNRTMSRRELAQGEDTFCLTKSCGKHGLNAASARLRYANSTLACLGLEFPVVDQQSLRPLNLLA